MDAEEKTLKGKQKLNWLDEYSKKILEKENKMKKMISDNSYITWLEEFTNKYSAFGDDDWLYNPLDIPKEDMQNVQMLQLLYNIIDNNKEYTTAIAAPSVAVNIPPVIPPIIITINDKLGIASKSTLIA